MCKESGCLNSKVRWLALQNSRWCSKKGKYWGLDGNLGHTAHISDKSAVALNKGILLAWNENLGISSLFKTFTNRGWNGRTLVLTF